MILDKLQKRGKNVFVLRGTEVYNLPTTNYTFSNVVWLNICDIIIDVLEDIDIKPAGNIQGGTDISARYIAFKRFVYSEGRFVLQKIYDLGFLVVGYDKEKAEFCVLDKDDYKTNNGRHNELIVTVPNSNLDIYVMQSSSFYAYGRSERSLCKGFLSMLDDVLNGSATVSKRLGATIVASPKNMSNAPAPIILTESDKKDIEDSLQKEYGALKNQNQVMVLPREMNWEVVNMSGLDLRMQEKVKVCILAIADRIKVPIQSVGMIDGNESKAFANGGEISEADKLKYKTFRRLFERTFGDMARYYGVHFNYSLQGEFIA